MREQVEPHRGHAGTEADFFRLEQFVQALAVEHGAGHHHFGANRGAGVGRAPGVDMKHRHHGHHHITRRQPKGVGQRRSIGMQHGGAVRIEHPLGVAGRARGVAKRRGEALVKLRPVEGARLRREQGFIAQQIGNGGLRHVRLVRHRHPAPDAGADRRELFDQGHEAEVKQHIAVLGVVDDIGELVREQARVDGVADRAHARHSEISLEMTVAVPGQCANALGLAHAQRRQRLGQLPGALVRRAIGAAVDRAAAVLVGPLDRARHNFGVAVMPIRVRDERRNQQRHIHHQTLQHAPLRFLLEILC